MTINLNLPYRALISICAGLAILLGSTLAGVLYQYYSDWQLTHQKIIAKPITFSDQSSQIIKVIPESHLFGEPLPQLGQVPVTNLQFRVTGIVKDLSGSSLSVSKTYISIAGRPSKIFRVGDTLPYGVKVYDITNNTVILENNGHLEKLSLPREILQFKKRR